MAGEAFVETDDALRAAIGHGANHVESERAVEADEDAAIPCAENIPAGDRGRRDARRRSVTLFEKDLEQQILRCPIGPDVPDVELQLCLELGGTGCRVRIPRLEVRSREME